MLERAKAELQRLDLVRPEELQPCTKEEVQRLELKLGHPLPEIYRAFLLWMGHGAGVLLQGTDAFYNNLFHLREWAVELLEENYFPHSLPNDAFVFYMQQGYLFYFLRLNLGNNSPIYYFGEGKEQKDFLEAFSDLEELLIAEIRVHAEAVKKLKRGGA